MTENGQDLLIKVKTKNHNQFETIAGLRVTRMNFNPEAVDANSFESIKVLSGEEFRWANISGYCVFKDESADERARQIFFDGETHDFQVIIPDCGIVEGPFKIAALEYSGHYHGEATYLVSLVSTGALQVRT